MDDVDEVTLLYMAFSFSATSLVIAIDSGSGKTMKGAGDFFRETFQEAGAGTGPKALGSTVL